MHIQAFADDVVMVVTGASRKALEGKAEHSLQIADEWAGETQVHFNMAKSKMLVVGRKYQGRQPNVIMQNQTLKKEKALKILGVIFDPGLTFLPHLEYVQKKVRILSHKLCLLSGPEWRFTGSKLAMVYKKGIERMIVYAAPVWYSAYPHKARKLRAIQTH